MVGYTFNIFHMVNYRRWSLSFHAHTGKQDIWQLAGLTTPLRIALLVIVFRLAEMPLSLHESLLTIIHFLEGLFLVLAMVSALFYFVSVLDRLLLQMPEELRKVFPFPVFDRLKRVLRLCILLFAGIVLIFQHAQFFPKQLFSFHWWAYFSIFAVIVIIFMVNRVIGVFFTKLTMKYKVSGENLQLRLMLRAAIWPIRILLTAFILFAAGKILTLPDMMISIKNSVTGALIAGAIFFFIYRLLDILEFRLSRYVQRDDNLLDLNFVQVVRLITRFVVVIVGTIYVVRALSGKPLTAIFTGLGIGGISIALAAQDTLKNLLGGVMIMMDKPFNVGDRILVEGCDGVIENIGFRSIRVRTLTGNLVTVPKEKMAGNQVENVGKHPHIRRLTNITLPYDTPVKKVEKAVRIIRDILDNHKGMHPDFPPRVYFNEFNDASINIIMI